jgi:predicted amidophosphoribosyltransferase
MPVCPQCDAPVPEDAAYCSRCGAAIDPPATPQPQELPNPSSDDAMHARLEKAMRRNEILTYAAAGLAVAILFVIILIAFL